MQNIYRLSKGIGNDAQHEASKMAKKQFAMIFQHGKLLFGSLTSSSSLSLPPQGGREEKISSSLVARLQICFASAFNLNFVNAASEFPIDWSCLCFVHGFAEKENFAGHDYKNLSCRKEKTALKTSLC